MYMKSKLGHVGINLSNSAKSFQFWKALLKYLGFELLEEGKNRFDAKSGSSYLCISVTGKNIKPKVSTENKQD